MKICIAGPRRLVSRRAFAQSAGCLLLLVSARPAFSQDFANPPDAEPLVVTATRLPVPEDQSPAAITVISAQDLSGAQDDRVADALRAVPGLDVVQTGAPGQLTSVFTRGLESRHTQVLIDGIPFNQGLAGLFDFADLTGDGLDRIEVERGPQSTLYGPRALAGTIQLFTRRGDEQSAPFTADVSAEGGSFSTFRERASAAGTSGGFDYSLAGSRVDTENDRPNDDYRNTDFLANLGYTPAGLPAGRAPRFGLLISYSDSETGDPNTIQDPRPIDHLLSERQLYAPNVDWQPTSWWHHHLVLEYDEERQVNNPNQDGFTGPTRAQFDRYQLDYQNDINWTRWLTLTTGAFYENVFAYQLRPDISQAFGPEPQYVKDFTESAAGFGQVSITPFHNALLVAGGRYDHFNLSGGVGTYRVAGSYLVAKTNTTFRSSVATGFSPPTPQDRIFRINPGVDLQPEKSFGYDFGFEQALFGKKLGFGANYFHEELSNVIGGDPEGNTFNLGSARTQGLEAFGHWEPLPHLLLKATYTYLDAVNTSGANFANEAPGARLPRRARNQGFASIYYTAFNRLTLGFEAKIVNGREDIGFPPPNYTPVNFDLGGYTVLRLLASYDAGAGFHIYARVENLGDERYQEVYGYPALRHGFYGGAAYHF
jgi:vitamin B12 transporter